MSLAQVLMILAFGLALPVVCVLAIVHGLRERSDEREIRAAERRMQRRESSKLGTLWTRHQSERLGFSSRVR